MAWSALATHTRLPSSSTPTVPVSAPGRRVARLPERGHRPRAVALELHHAEAGLEVDADQLRGDGPIVARARLDGRGVEERVAHGDREAALIEDHAAGEALGAEGGRRRAVLGGADPETDHRRLDALDEGGQLGDLTRIVAEAPFTEGTATARTGRDPERPPGARRATARSASRSRVRSDGRPRRDRGWRSYFREYSSHGEALGRSLRAGKAVDSIGNVKDHESATGREE